MTAMIDVVVPAYRRPELLRRCLRALRAQTLAPARVIVVTRTDDWRSAAVVAEEHWPSLAHVKVRERGVLAALTAGVAESTAPIVAFTDDDAAARPGWIEGVAAALADARVGGVGGRDVLPGQTEPRRHEAGRLKRWGKLVGYHHLAVGPPRQVDVLKGVNMAFRASCLALPRPGTLRGDGAQVHFEVLVCRWAAQRGAVLLLDPAIEVDHVGAVRLGRDRRDHPDASAVRDVAFNFVVATTALDPRWRLRQLAYGLLVGSTAAPGLLRTGVALARGERETVRRAVPALAGCLDALRAPRRRPHEVMATAAELRTQRTPTTPMEVRATI